MAKILVIDDDEQMRNMLHLCLTHEGYEVLRAHNGQAGIETFDQNGADLVITDLVMPEKDGIETILALRRIFPAIKIIAISGGKAGPSNGHLALAKHLGAQVTMEKPFSMSELLEVVRSLLKLRV